jgi:hypothetical protein
MSMPNYSSGGGGGALNLDDIFGDVMFTPDGDTVFMSEQQDVLPSGEAQVSTMARKMKGSQFVPVEQGGGLLTTQLHEREKPSLTMGRASSDTRPTPAVPFKKAPQERNHLQYAMPSKKKSSRGDRNMSEQQKSERR